jgi:hypothetical protein
MTDLKAVVSAYLVFIVRVVRISGFQEAELDIIPLILDNPLFEDHACSAVQ